MYKERAGLGYSFVLISRPDLEFDLEQLSDKMVEEGTIDEIAIELELMGSGSARTIRTNALRRLGVFCTSQDNKASDMLRFMAKNDPALAAWAGAACVREFLIVVPAAESRPRLAVEAVEQWCAGSVSNEELLIAARRARNAGNDFIEGPLARAYFACDAAYFLAAWTGSPGAAPDTMADMVRIAVRVVATAEGDREAEDRRLTKTIADVLPGMPVRVR